jgi:AraC-like DNA-binding protein
VLRLVRSVALPRLNARRDFVALRQPGFRAYVLRLEGMHYEALDRSSGRALASFANELTLVLRGAWVDRRHGEVTLGPNEAASGPASTRPDAWRDGSLLVTLEWNEPRIERWSRFTLTPAATRAADAFVEAVSQQGERSRDVPSLQRLLAALRDDGHTLPELVAQPPPEEAQRAAHMLNTALTQLSNAPMWVDFTSSRSERQWRRDLQRASEWVGLVGGSFRGTLNTIRLSFAVSLLTAPGATLKEIAAALGYRNDRTLLQALQRAGLSPSKVRGRPD